MKVCIVGFIPSGWQYAPWPAAFFSRRSNDWPTSQLHADILAAWETRAATLRAKGPWEIWGFNGLYRELGVKVFDRWFELHAPDKGLGQRGWIEPIEELRIISRHVRLYLTQRSRSIPKAFAFPKRQVEGLSPHGRYHCGSLDWMVGFAILKRFTHIRIVGVNFQAGGEPISARPCLEYWLGLAEGRRITTEIVGGDVFRAFHLVRSDNQYGFDAMRLVEDRLK